MVKNQLRAGVMLSYANLALGMLIPFFYTPIMLEILGQAEYGLYSLSSSTVSYLSLLSFGFGTTIIRYISKYRAEGNKKAVEETFGFFLMLYSIMAVLALLGGLGISANVELIFKNGLDMQEMAKMKILVVILSISTALSFPVSVFSSVIASYERFIYEKVLNLLSTLAGPLANLAALYLGYSSVGMVFAGVALQFIFLPLKVCYCFRNLQLRPKFAKLPGTLIREMFGFSFFAFLASIIDLLFWSTDKVILGMRASTVAVAVYNMGATFNSIVINLSTSISGVLVPRVTGMVTQNTPKQEWTNLFVRIGRLQFIIIGLVISGFAVFGFAFLDLWVGEEYRNAFWVAILTLCPLCIPLIQSAGLVIITAQNKHKFRSIVFLCIAVINVVSTYLIVPRMGMIGAALCTCGSYLLGQGLIMNIYYYKVTGLDIPLFWKNILKMAIVPAIMLVAGIWLLRKIAITNWLIFFALVAAYTLIYIVLMYLFSLNNYEKDILRKPIRKVFNR